ncbi:MAG TPA: hypothetical protein VJ757_13195 [Pseudonocardiaceae bacterium]|nr:hypothetical protein [Pseudonocardiaceae bacterium]
MTQAFTSRPRARAVLATALTATAALLFMPGLVPRAAATVIDVQCSGTFVRDFTPPVMTTAQPVAVTETDSYSLCVTGPAGTGTITTTLVLSCVNLTALPPQTETITWTGGQTSTITWATPVAAGQTVVFTGAVTAGPYQGDTAVKVTSGISYLGTVLPCLLGSPISQTTGLDDSLTLTGT